MTCPTTNRRALLTAAGAGMAVSAMMQTLLGNATPRIVDELAAPELYGWVAGSYLVCSTLLLPPFSQYTDRLGTRRVLVAGHACFLTGTLLMSWAPTMPLLLAARAVQGIGAAAITPAVLAALGLQPWMLPVALAVIVLLSLGISKVRELITDRNPRP